MDAATHVVQSNPTSIESSGEVNIAEMLSDSERQETWPLQGLIFDPVDITINDFYLKNRAYRPLVPCIHCSTLGLQCFILQTTTANPNPITSCSSCVALFRECDLAGGQKRPPSNFETSKPVIGQLHGVNEEETLTAPDDVFWDPSSAMMMTTPTISNNTKRSWSRSVKKTRILRNWFACHFDHPYPTEEEKILLAQQSNLTKTQVSCWFTNARRRHRQSTQDLSNKVFLQGSPMVRSSLLNMTPFDRWRNSPPEDEPVPASTIERNLDTFLSSNDYLVNFYPTRNMDICESSSGVDSDIYSQSALQCASSNSASSCYSHSSTNRQNIFSLSVQSSEDGKQLSNLPPSTPRTADSCTYHCTFCLRGFKKKYDWLRHERTIHMPGLDLWVCTTPLPADQPPIVWRLKQSSPQCILCGHPSPSDEHLQSHEFEACSERPLLERTFSRKDHLWQHLHKFHGCRKWDGWNPNLKLLQLSQDEVRSRCGFCGAEFESWEKRERHLASHFQSGMTMDQWIGDCGIREPMESVVQGARTVHSLPAQVP